MPVPELSAGEVGYVLAGMKSLAGLAIGDTLTEGEDIVFRALAEIQRRRDRVLPSRQKSSVLPLRTCP